MLQDADILALFWCILRKTFELNILQRKSLQQKCQIRSQVMNTIFDSALNKCRSVIRGSEIRIIYSCYL
jgi:hypothetical protein